MGTRIDESWEGIRKRHIPRENFTDVTKTVTYGISGSKGSKAAVNKRKVTAWVKTKFRAYFLLGLNIIIICFGPHAKNSSP